VTEARYRRPSVLGLRVAQGVSVVGPQVFLRADDAFFATFLAVFFAGAAAFRAASAAAGSCQGPLRQLPMRIG